MNEEDQLNESELGTKEYWEKAYNIEKDNFDTHGDIGEIWFGRNVQNRLVTYLCNKFSDEKEKSDVKVLDVGCGNGSLSISLAENGFRKVTGVDYAVGAVELAEHIAKRSGIISLNFYQLDVLNVDSSSSSFLNGSFDLILDKGTYDAISLSSNAVLARNKYTNSIVRLFNPDSDHKLFIIASCNWTGEELVNCFLPEFKLIDEIKTPTLTFGGRTGTNVSICVFRLQS